jgi:hypothetical protein
MTSSRVLIAVAAVTFSLAAGHGRAWGAVDHTNHLTFKHTMALPGVTLPAGVYTFEIANPESSARVVRVWSRDRSRLYFSDFANTVRRPATLPADQIVRLGEAPAGAPVPILTWFPIGSGSGYEFKYR